MTVSNKSEVEFRSLSNSGGRVELIQSLKTLKNSIIGSPTRKCMYLKSGISQRFASLIRLVEYLNAYKSDTELLLEIAPVISSLAQYDVQKLLEAGILAPLLEALSCDDSHVIISCAKAIRSVVQNSIAKIELLPVHLENLIVLSRPPISKSTDSVSLSSLCISILARIAESESERDYLVCMLPSLIEWLDQKWAHFPRVQESALHALSRLCKGPGIDAEKDGFQDILFALLSDKRSSMRLEASACLVNLTIFYNNSNTNSISKISNILLPAIIRLFDDITVLSAQSKESISIQERAYSLFSALVTDRAKLQEIALKEGAISKLALILTTMTFDKSIKDSTKLIESTLLAIAAVSSLTEECRREVIDLKLLPIIVTCLKDNNVHIRGAACKCSRSLSRSVKILRTSLMDAGLAKPLFDLLFDSDIQVQITASATLCNIVLDFSPMKKIVIECGGVQQLVKLVESCNQELRLNAVWALKNMLFQTDIETKRVVMLHLEWSRLAM